MFDICYVEKCINEPYHGLGGFVGRFCSQHEYDHYKCQESNCLAFISSQGFCSQHARFCDYCRNEVRREYKKYCDVCADECKTCRVEIHKGENGLCSSHKVGCHYGSHRCSKKVGKSGEYCEDHKKECEFEDCEDRINNYSNHCFKHPREKQIEEYKRKRDNEKDRADREENRANGLQNQLNDAIRERDARPTTQQYIALQTKKNDLMLLIPT